MKSILYFIIAHIGCTVLCATTKTAEDNIRELQDLDKEHEEIFKLMTAAIEDTIKKLTLSNASTAIEGIAYMKELKSHVNDLNNTDANLTPIFDAPGPNDSLEEMLDLKEILNFKSENFSGIDVVRNGKEKDAPTGYENIKKILMNNVQAAILAKIQSSQKQDKNGDLYERGLALIEDLKTQPDPPEEKKKRKRKKRKKKRN